MVERSFRHPARRSNITPANDEVARGQAQLRRPLEGVTVLDLTAVWAGPMGTSLLGDLGARVIKVESYPQPSITRTMGGGSRPTRGYSNNDPSGPRPWDRAAIHNTSNRNKLGITLNLRHSKGADIFRRLVKVSDILTESFSSATADKLGINYSDVRELHPSIILISMPGWGGQGPYRGYLSLGSVVDGFTGHHAIRGYPDSDPTLTPQVQHVDAIAAVTLPLAALVALHHRNRTGEGQWVDISQVESFLPHLSYPIMDYVMNQREPQRVGNRDSVMVPHNCYRCRGEDDWVVITVTCEEEWRGLCHAMGDPEWGSDERFSSHLSRYQHQTDLDSLIEGWTCLRDKREVMELLQQSGVPAAAVLDDGDLYSDPHLLARNTFEEIVHPLAGTHRYPGYMWKFSKMQEPVRLPPNCYGEHNHHVYGSILGMSDREIRELERDGVIGDEVPLT